MNPLGYVKDHPYLTGSLIVGSIVLFMMLRSGGSSGAASGGDMASIYAAQAGAQTATNQINAGLQAQTASLGAQLEDTKIRAMTAENLAGLSANVELAKINATQEVTDLANTLTANVALKNIQSGVDVAAINADVTKSQYSNMMQILITQSNDARMVAQSSIDAAKNSKGSCMFFC